MPLVQVAIVDETLSICIVLDDLLPVNVFIDKWAQTRIIVEKDRASGHLAQLGKGDATDFRVLFGK